MKFRQLSIEHKLNLLVLLAVTTAMVLASSLLISRYARATHAQYVEDLATLAAVIGSNSRAALAFQDPGDAAETLAALEGKPMILTAMLYDRDGRGFARYDRVPVETPEYPALPATEEPFAAGPELWKATPVRQNNEQIGTLVLRGDLQPITAAIRRQILFALLITAGSVAVAMLLASRIQHLMLRHIRRVVDMANAMALGDLPPHLVVTSEDEIGELERAFNQIVDATRSVVRQTQTLARGDYSITIEPRSERDELSRALIAMTRSLKSFHEEGVRQAWLKTGLADLNDRIRGEPTLHELAGNMLACVVDRIEAQAALLHVREEQDCLRVAGAHAVALPPEQAPVTRFGEGLVGQVARDGRLTVVAPPEGETLALRSGLLDQPLHALALVPLVHDQAVAGVLELGCMAGFTEDQLEFLRLAAPTMAIAIETARSRHLLNELLAETQRQSRELQSQQAALQTSNRELEQRNQLLENQKQEIHRQNDALEAARLDLERKARELEQASQYKSEFLANMSHELRTPLNSMLILSRLLADNKSGNLTEKQVDFARTIHKSGSDLLTLINDILDLSKVEAGMLEMHREPVLLDDIAGALPPLFKPLAAEKGLEFTVRSEPGLPRRLVTDAQRVSQILRNLIGNAFKFTRQGSVTLRVWRPAPGQSAAVPDAVAFSVIDTGIGIPPDKHALIFRAFQQADGTTSRQYGGTGLGLSISRELAVRLGGDLTVDSEPGKGSTFTLWLPAPVGGETEEAAQAPASSPAPVAAAAPVPSGKGRRLLIIEDDAAFAGVVAELARERGYEPLVAATGEEGFQAARAHRPAGILLDVMLPGADGHAVLNQLKHDPATRTIPVHIISALEQDQQLARQGAVGFLSKPVSPQQIHAAISRIEWVVQRPRKTIMVVDDDAADLEAVQQLLAAWPLHVVACRSGKEALHLARTTELDGILLDWGLPDMSGRAVLEALEPIPPDRYVPVLLYTGRDLDREEEAALRRRVVGVVVKGEQATRRLREKLAFYLHIEPPVESPPPAPASPARPDPALQGKTIMVVDDDMRNAFSLSAVIESWGAESRVAPDGARALAALEQDPRVDLVLMDIMMPGMDGYQAMREIRRRPALKELPIIALTAKAMKEDREACLAAGANDYLAKPVDMDQLLLMAKSWLRRT